MITVTVATNSNAGCKGFVAPNTATLEDVALWHEHDLAYFSVERAIASQCDGGARFCLGAADGADRCSVTIECDQQSPSN